MSFLTDDLAQTLIVTGVLLLVLEILVLGFATFYLFFVGLGAIAAGAIFLAGLMEVSLLSAFFLVAAFSVLAALLLWRPLKHMQRNRKPQAVTSDLVGHRFTLQQSLAVGDTQDYAYSGIRWKLYCTQAIAANTEVEVVELSVGRMRIAAVKVSDAQ
ncbi:MAG: NfeD family protein [Pseudomonadales bacterium]